MNAATTVVPAPKHVAKRRGREVYSYFWGAFEFDVDLAWELVHDAREAIEIETESVQLSVEDSIIDPDHVERVDPTIPGLIAHIYLRDENGVMRQGHVLIDGHHRAARCLKENLPFSAYILSEHESLAILTKSPPDEVHGSPPKRHATADRNSRP